MRLVMFSLRIRCDREDIKSLHIWSNNDSYSK